MSMPGFLSSRFAAFALALVVGLTGAADAQSGALTSTARAAAARRAALASATQPARVAPQALSGKPHDVVISRSRHPQAAAHIDHAQRMGQPTVLHIDRGGANARRRASTGRVHSSTRPAPTYERDEYPPAVTREGGHNANVRFIDRHDNRGAGSSIRAQTRGLPDGSRIRIVLSH